MTCRICKHPAEDKPYCLAHLDHLPYVIKLKSDLSNLSAERALSQQRKTSRHVTRDSLVIHDILSYLYYTTEPPLRAALAKYFDFQPNELRVYLNSMVRFGFIKEVDEAVRLTDEGLACLYA